MELQEVNMDKKVLRNLSYGLYVITSKEENKNVGCIANSVIQVTSNPVTILVSINHDNYTSKIIKETNKFGVSILKETSSQKIIGTFGFKSSKDINKFEEIEYKEVSNIPIINDSCGYMICNVVKIVETSTHTIFIAEVENTGDYTEENPMTYKYYHENLKGISPKNAPTYQEKEELVYDNKTNKWKCTICGYEYEADELPDDFKCPICGVGKEYFKKITK